MSTLYARTRYVRTHARVFIVASFSDPGLLIAYSSRPTADRVVFRSTVVVLEIRNIHRCARDGCSTITSIASVTHL